MKYSIDAPHARTVAFIAAVAVCATACGGKTAEGNTYADNGGVVKIEFKSDGKAYVSTGPVTTTVQLLGNRQVARAGL